MCYNDVMNNEKEQSALQNILDLIEWIERVTMDVLYEDFISDQVLIEAVAFSLMKLSYSLQHLAAEDKQKLEEVDIDKMGELDKKLLILMGEEFDDLVWKLVTESVPMLRKRIEGIE